MLPEGSSGLPPDILGAVLETRARSAEAEKQRGFMGGQAEADRALRAELARAEQLGATERTQITTDTDIKTTEMRMELGEKQLESAFRTANLDRDSREKIALDKRDLQYDLMDFEAGQNKLSREHSMGLKELEISGMAAHQHLVNQGRIDELTLQGTQQVRLQNMRTVANRSLQDSINDFKAQQSDLDRAFQKEDTRIRIKAAKEGRLGDAATQRELLELTEGYRSSREAAAQRHDKELFAKKFQLEMGMLRMKLASDRDRENMKAATALALDKKSTISMQYVAVAAEMGLDSKQVKAIADGTFEGVSEIEAQVFLERWASKFGLALSGTQALLAATMEYGSGMTAKEMVMTLQEEFDKREKARERIRELEAKAGDVPASQASQRKTTVIEDLSKEKTREERFKRKGRHKSVLDFLFFGQ